MLQVLHVLLPEVSHGGERIVTAHRPHRIRIRTRKQDVLGILQRQHTVVLQQHHRLRGDIISRLTLLGGVEYDLLITIKVGILVKQTGTELMAQHILHGTLQRLIQHQTFVEGILQILIIGTMWEIHVIAGIDGSSSLFHRCLPIRQLIDGGVVAHHHTVEA